MLGTIKTLVFSNRYGFIRRHDGGPDVFFHMSDLEGLTFDPRLDGLRVTFDLTADSQDRPKACRVQAAD